MIAALIFKIVLHLFYFIKPKYTQVNEECMFYRVYSSDNTRVMLEYNIPVPTHYKLEFNPSHSYDRNYVRNLIFAR
jgi:citrate lyase synthetase